MILSQLYICRNVPIDENHNNTIFFKTRNKQTEYFDSLVDTSLTPIDDYSYIKQNESIKVPFNVDDLLGCNYLFYNNDGKRYYCFITDKVYINDECTRLDIKIDVMQTFLVGIDYTIKDALIDRQIQLEATQQLEELEMGDEYSSLTKILPFISSGDEYYEDRYIFLFMYIYATETLQTTTPKEPPTSENDILTGFYNYVVPICIDTNTGTIKPTYTIDDKGVQNFNSASSVLENLIDEAKVHQILISPIPPTKTDIIPNSNYSQFEVKFRSGSSSQDRYFHHWVECGNYNLIAIVFRDGNQHEIVKKIPLFNNRRMTADSFNKIEIYPYNFYKIRWGDKELTIKPKDFIGSFSSTDHKGSYYTDLYAFQSLSEAASSYIRLTFGKSESTIINQVPTFITLRTDAWKQYMLQNRAQRTASFVSLGTSTAGGLLGGLFGGGIGLFGGLAMIGNAFNNVHQQLAKEQDIKNQPADIRTFNGDLSSTYSLSYICPYITHMKLQTEFEENISNYFKRFGYKVNSFGQPNVNTNKYWNFVKTSNITLSSSLDTKFRSEIENIFNMGITFWHQVEGEPIDIGNYSKENTFIMEETQQ